MEVIIIFNTANGNILIHNLLAHALISNGLVCVCVLTDIYSIVTVTFLMHEYMSQTLIQSYMQK